MQSIGSINVIFIELSHANSGKYCSPGSAFLFFDYDDIA